MRITSRKFFFPAVFILLVLAFVLFKLWSPSGGYKAVSLTDQMTYFGKIKDLNANFLVLTDVFYVRAKTVSGKESTPAAGGYELVKLGGELHGPEDAIIINRKQIISIQSLKEDSQVIQAIRGYYLTHVKPGR